MPVEKDEDGLPSPRGRKPPPSPLPRDDRVRAADDVEASTARFPRALSTLASSGPSPLASLRLLLVLLVPLLPETPALPLPPFGGRGASATRPGDDFAVRPNAWDELTGPEPTARAFSSPAAPPRRPAEALIARVV
jgi:hypothetical protein